MKTLTKSELTILAIVAFTNNESIIEVYGTEDGQIFYDANRANLHATTFEKKLKVYPISRGDAEQATKKESKAKEASVAPKAPLTTDKKPAKKVVPTLATEQVDETKDADKSETPVTEDKTATSEAELETQK